MTRARGDTPGAPPARAFPRDAPAEPPGHAAEQRAARPRRSGSGRHAHVYAALDLGTNNCRLLIARPEGRGFRVLDAFSRIVRLGEGMETSNRLSDDAMERAVAALRVCADKMRRRGVTRARAIATEACRRAENGDAFVGRVLRETGVRLDVIAAGEEARLAVAGCAPLFDPRRDCLLVFDIGGGSTEIVWIDLAHTPRERRRDLLMGVAPRDANPKTIAREVQALADRARWVSLPVGVVTLAERFKRIADERERFAAMRAHTEALIGPFARDGAGATPDRLRRMQLLGTSGTITTLAGVHLGLPRYTRSEVDGLWMRSADLHGVIDSLLRMDRAERALAPCVGDDRADLVISGAAILRAITAFWPTERLRVADRGLREGLLYGLMNREDALARQPKRRADP